MKKVKYLKIVEKKIITPKVVVKGEPKEQVQEEVKQKKPPKMEDLILKWFNEHLEKAGVPIRVHNYEGDMQVEKEKSNFSISFLTFLERRSISLFA